MDIEYTKMHGCGNDYVYINGFKQKIDDDKKPDFVRKISDRHFGIGSDGAIFINPSDKADFEMEMYNADGTRSEMCGNGIRCVAKYVYDHGMTDRTEITIESFDKVKRIWIDAVDGTAKSVKVDMGKPVLKSSEIPVTVPPAVILNGNESRDDNRVINVPITVNGYEYHMTCVSMGNPHAVFFMDPDKTDIEGLGSVIEVHECFPARTNVEFVRVDDRSNIHMRVWERGTGETMACGTGCCATAVACILNGLTDRQVTVHVLGGDIEVLWDENDGHVYMTGPAETVFNGVISV
jgi:diaminopimelate epimerase